MSKVSNTSNTMLRDSPSEYSNTAAQDNTDNAIDALKMQVRKPTDYRCTNNISSITVNKVRHVYLTSHQVFFGRPLNLHQHTLLTPTLRATCLNHGNLPS